MFLDENIPFPDLTFMPPCFTGVRTPNVRGGRAWRATTDESCFFKGLPRSWDLCLLVFMTTAVDINRVPELLGYWAADICYQTFCVLVILSIATWVSEVFQPSRAKKRAKRRLRRTSSAACQGPGACSASTGGASEEGVHLGRDKPPLPFTALARITAFLDPPQQLKLSSASKALVATVQSENRCLQCRWPGEQSCDREPLVRVLARHQRLESLVLHDLLAVIAFSEAVVVGCCSTLVQLGVDGRRRPAPGSLLLLSEDEERRLRRSCQQGCHVAAVGLEHGEDRGQARGQGAHGKDGQPQHGPGVVVGQQPPVDSTWCLILCSRLAVNLMPRLTRLRLGAGMGTPGLVALACALEARSLEFCRPLEQLHISGWAGSDDGLSSATDSALALRALLRCPSCCVLQDLEMGDSLGPAEVQALAEYLRGGGAWLRRVSLTAAPSATPPRADGLLEALASGRHARLEVLQLEGFQFSAKSVRGLHQRGCRLSPALQQLSLTQAGGLDECLPAILGMLGGGGELSSLRLESVQEGGSVGKSSVPALLTALEGGALPRLQHLRLGHLLDGGESVGALVETLARRPPCASSLKSLDIDTCLRSGEGVRGLAAAMEEGGVLRAACPDLRHVGLHVMHTRAAVHLPSAPEEVLAALQLERADCPVTSIQMWGRVGQDSLGLLKGKILAQGACPLLKSVYLMNGSNVVEEAVRAFVREVGAARPSVKVSHAVAPFLMGLPPEVGQLVVEW